MGCCNWRDKRECTKEIESSAIGDAESFVRILLWPQVPQLMAFTRYGHQKPEYYVQVGAYRVSLYFDDERGAWHNAAHIMKAQLVLPSEWSLEPQKRGEG